VSPNSKNPASLAAGRARMNAADETARLRRLWPDAFRDGARCAFLRRFDGDREEGGYPHGFHAQPLERRNAWFAGFNRGFHDRLRLTQQETA
jgi:hypothetical protein